MKLKITEEQLKKLLNDLNEGLGQGSSSEKVKLHLNKIGKKIKL